MKKKNESILSKWFIIFAICSVMVALVEGILFYTAEAYPNAVFRFMLIIQNSIKAFGFQADISLVDIANIIENSENVFQKVIGYIYAISLFIAPYCTLNLVYKVIARVFKISTWRYFPSSARRIIVFGYNDEVKALFKQKGKNGEKRRIHLVTTNVSEKDERELIKNKIILHQIDCLGMSVDQIKYFAKQMELKKATDIILYEKSSARNFSLYNMFHNISIQDKILSKDVKFFCRCEDEGIKRILEDYYDTRIREKKEQENLIVQENPITEEKIQVFKDLEIVSISELRIRKMLKEKPLHQYYLNKNNDKLNKIDKLDELDKWNLHLLIVGFGKLGQQLLLQAMNQGVITSKNEILIDVIDFNIEEKKSIFANNFGDKYVKMNDDEYTISSSDNEKAEGELKIRFHKMDIRYKQFYEILKKNGSSDNGGIYTYIAICVPNADVSLHCMSEVERYLRTQKCDKDVSLGIRIETDREMANYLNENTKTYSNVFAIEEKECTIDMDDLLMDNMDKEAKEYSRLYNELLNSISIMAEKDKNKDNGNSKDNQFKNDEEKYTKESWRALEIFRRNSNRALASHQDIKKEFFKIIDKKEIENAIGVNGTIMKAVGNGWVIEGNIQEFTEKLCDSVKYRYISELVRMEHRRWCYFMASCGWERTDKPDQKKDDVNRKNPCMCTWEELKKYNSDKCIYDMMPLLLEYKYKKKKQ